MTTLVPYDSYEPPEEYAHKVCEFLRDSTAPLTFAAVMIVHLQMGDPESRRRTEMLVRQWVQPGGPYEDLTLNRKYSVQNKRAAERLGVPYKRNRGLVVINRMKIVDQHVARVEQARHTPIVVRQAITAKYRLIEQNSGKMLGRARTAEFLSSEVESHAVLSSEFRSKDERIAALEQEKAFLQKALLAALNGGGGHEALPAPDGDD
jgi:hypothetical protein